MTHGDSGGGSGNIATPRNENHGGLTPSEIATLDALSIARKERDRLAAIINFDPDGYNTPDNVYDDYYAAQECVANMERQARAVAVALGRPVHIYIATPEGASS